MLPVLMLALVTADTMIEHKSKPPRKLKFFTHANPVAKRNDGQPEMDPAKWTGSDPRWSVSLLRETRCGAKVMDKSACVRQATWDLFRRNVLQRPAKRALLYDRLLQEALERAQAENNVTGKSDTKPTKMEMKQSLAAIGDAAGPNRKEAQGGPRAQRRRLLAEQTRPRRKLLAADETPSPRRKQQLLAAAETPMEQLMHKLRPGIVRNAAEDAKHPALRTLGDALSFDATRGLLFIHVPKAGGTSIELALKKVHAISDNYTIGLECKRPLRTMAAENFNAAHVVEHMAVAAIRDCHGYTRPIRSFAVLREPAARLYSSYRWLRQRSEVVPRFSNFSAWLKHEAPHLFKMRQTDFIGPCTMLFAMESGEAWDYLRSEYPGIQPIQVQSLASLGVAPGRVEAKNAPRQRRSSRSSTFGAASMQTPPIDPVTRNWIRNHYLEDYSVWHALMERAKQPNGWRKPRRPECGVDDV